MVNYQWTTWIEGKIVIEAKMQSSAESRPEWLDLFREF